MALRPALPAAIFAALLAFPPAAAEAQRIGGHVVFQGWDEPAAGADVALLDSMALATVARQTADADGRFVFAPLEPGVYHLQASSGGLQSTLLGPFSVSDADEADALVLELPSALLHRGLRCLADAAAAAGADASPGGVIIGVAYEAGTGMPLPGALVSVEWGETGRRELATARTDAQGHYCIATARVGAELSVWLAALNQVTDPTTGIELDAGGITRVDLALESGIVASATEVTETRVISGGTATLIGRVTDAATGEPVRDADVRVEGARDAVTDAQGRFRIDNMPAGTRLLRVQRLGYQGIDTRLDLGIGTETTVELRLGSRAIALDPLAVEGRAQRVGGMAAAPLARHSVSGGELAAVAARGTQLHELVRARFPLNVQEWRDGHGSYHLCVQARRREVLATEGVCETVAIVVDGFVVEDPVGFYRSARLDDYASVEYLQPLEAGIRYGLEAGRAGAIVLWSHGRLPQQRRQP